jgi:hypothetical protein
MRPALPDGIMPRERTASSKEDFAHVASNPYTLGCCAHRRCRSRNALGSPHGKDLHDWRTERSIPAPLPLVYEAMTSPSAVRQWWPPMELVDDGGGERLRVGSTVSFRVHQEAPEVARLAPPFRIHRLSTHGRRGARARRLCARSLLADL